MLYREWFCLCMLHIFIHVYNPDLNLTPLAAFLHFLPSAARLAALGKKRKKAARGVRFKSGLTCIVLLSTTMCVKMSPHLWINDMSTHRFPCQQELQYTHKLHLFNDNKCQHVPTFRLKQYVDTQITLSIYQLLQKLFDDFNSLGPRQNGWHCAEVICNFFFFK